jgi:hypothetical protein
MSVANERPSLVAGKAFRSRVELGVRFEGCSGGGAWWDTGSDGEELPADVPIAATMLRQVIDPPPGDPGRDRPCRL